MDVTSELIELEQLRLHAPPPPEQHLSSDRLAHLKEALMNEIDGRSTATGDRRSRFAKRVIVVALLPAALIGGAVAYSMSANRSADQLGNEVTCFQALKLDAPAAGAPFTGQDLAAFCQNQWISGSIIDPPPLCKRYSEPRQKQPNRQ